MVVNLPLANIYVATDIVLKTVLSIQKLPTSDVHS